MFEAGQTVTAYIRKHAIVLTCSILAGVVSGLPYVLAVFDIGDAYKGIPFFFQANEDYYLARIREIFDGHGFVSSPFFFEYKSLLPLMPPTGEYLYALLALVTGLSLPSLLVFAKFLLPAVLFMLVYLLIHTLTIQDVPNLARRSAIAGATLVVVGIGLVDYNDIIGHLLHGTTWPALSMWTRPVNPITGALFLFVFLSLLVRVRSHGHAVGGAAGVVLALMLGYIFSFGVALAILGTLSAFALWFRDYEYVKRLLVIAFVALIVFSAYVLIVVSSLGEGSLGRSGLVLGHAPLLNKVSLLALLVMIGLFIFRRRVQKLSLDWNTSFPLWFSLSLIIASLAALNQQILTGLSIWPYHLVQYTVPLAIVAIISAGTIIIGPLYTRIWNALLLSAVAISFAFATWNVFTYVHALPLFSDIQRYAPALAWLNENAEKDCVVLVVEDEYMRFTNLVPGFTPCNVYHALHISGHIPAERIEHNYFVQLRLRGVDAETIETYLMAHKDEVLSRYHTDWHELFAPIESNERIPGLIPSIGLRYREFYERDFLTAIQTFRVDYLVDTGILNLNALSRLSAKKVFEQDGVTVYEF